MNASMKAVAVLCCVVGAPAYSETYNVVTGQLLEHCAARQGAPDDFCIGYMDASINFVSSYQSWLSINRYDFPAGEKVICFPGSVTTVEAVDALRKYMSSSRDQTILAQKAMITLARAFSAAFPCTKPN